MIICDYCRKPIEDPARLNSGGLNGPPIPDVPLAQVHLHNPDCAAAWLAAAQKITQPT